RLCGYVESRWRETQREVVEKSILLHGHNSSVKQIELAKDMALTTQALNQRIQSSGYYNYIRTRKELAQLLQAEWGDHLR
ncbi:MAG TPA: SatD family protein, partial [Proteiniclasticum sp.]|nr:SatD family protein [Proteiniclasticum sp.]